MATDIAPLHKAWNRLIRGQFGLRFLLLLTLLVALGAWWYSQRLPPGHIRHRDTLLVKHEMTPAQVTELLGEPLDEGRSSAGPLWSYKIVDSSRGSGPKLFQIVFHKGEVWTMMEL